MIITIEELQALHENMIQLYHEWQRAGHLLDQGKIESREYEWKLYAKARDTYILNHVLKAIELTDMEERLSKIERLLNE